MSISLDKFGKGLMRAHLRTIDRIDKGLIQAATEGKKHMRKHTPKGSLQRSWKAQGRLLRNVAPHAGIVENGARPHPVSKEGIESIKKWAIKHLGFGKVRDTKGRFVKSTKVARDWLDQEASQAAYGIAKKLEREGQAPTYFVRNQLLALTKIAKQKVEKALHGRRKATG